MWPFSFQKTLDQLRRVPSAQSGPVGLALRMAELGFLGDMV